ncbi:Nucleoporin nup184 [Sphaceloma murrayae]|uniref:Nucleoporin nup184 n=1 Tax=Sphaceloma murrayae TaxID=2082308 RepID=A0A2K1QNF7_9PEZI|nr:Nucleoporin nup184 [Sphaceloma murrayae]
MAPAGNGSFYLPALEDCLQGRHDIISWHDVYICLTDPSLSGTKPPVDRVLKDEQIRDLLVTPFAAFPKPSAASRAKYDNLTSAINVPTSNEGGYNVSELQEDANWLSKDFELDEVSALRIVLLEWQGRRARELVSEWTEEEIQAIRNATPTPSSDVLTAAITPTRATQSVSPRHPEEAQKQRRLQILHVFFKEQEYFWKTSETMAGCAQKADLQFPDVTGSYTVPSDVHMALVSIWKLQRTKYSDEDRTKAVQGCARALKSVYILGCERDQWHTLLKESSELATVFTYSLLERMVSQLRLLQLHLYPTRKMVATSAEVVSWYDLLDECAFFTQVQYINSDASLLHDMIGVLVAFVSVEILTLVPAIESLDTLDPAPSDQDSKLSTVTYLEDTNCLQSVTVCLIAAVEGSVRSATPAVLAWACITRRIYALNENKDGLSERRDSTGTFGEESPTVARKSILKMPATPQRRLAPLKKAIDEAHPELKDVADRLGRVAIIDLEALETTTMMLNGISSAFRLPSEVHTLICCRLSAYDLVHSSMVLKDYDEAITAAIIEMHRYDTVRLAASSRDSLTLWPDQPAQTLDEDRDVMGRGFMLQVVNRYPYEIGPFLTCLEAIGRSRAYVDQDGSRIARLLEGLDSFTCSMPADWPYAPVGTSERMVLQEPLPIIGLRRGAPSSFAGNVFTIPAGTVGINVSNTNEAVMRWDYPHSALEYLGIYLSTFGDHAKLELCSQPIDQGIHTVADTIALITTMIRGNMASADPDAAKGLLGSISNAMTRNEDIVSVIFGIFEDRLQNQALHPGSAASLSVLCRCIEFMRVILHLYPERVWSHLSRTCLLPLNDSAGAISTIVGATEVPMARFDFLAACISLFESLVDDCLRRAVSSKGVNNARAVARFGEETPGPASTARKTMSTLLFSLSGIAIDVLQTQPNWRFTDTLQRYAMNEAILKTSCNLLLHTCPRTSSGGELFAMLQPAAANIVTTYFADSAGSLPIQSLTDMFVTALSELRNLEDSRANHDLVAMTCRALQFGTMLLRIGLIQGRAGSALRKQLLEAVPLLARLYAIHDAVKPRVAEMLTVLVQYEAVKSEDPQSLLGHLPSQATKTFVQIISNIDSPLQSLNTEAVLWDMLSAVVSNKQQWLTMNLLTGTTPRKALEAAKNDKQTKSKSLITLALHKAADLASMAPRRAVAILAFISHAQSHWKWVSGSIASHPTFVSSSIDWLSKLTATARQADTEACIRNANENQMASFLCDILARFLHETAVDGRHNEAKSIASKLSHLRDYSPRVNAYNHSLHRNLSKNFDQKFNGVSLESFKRSSLKSAELGPDYYYDLELATAVLGFDPSWRRTKGQGFVDEVARANVNFSLVDSEIALLKSFKTLALELCSIGLDDGELQNDMAKVASGCLQANIDSTFPEQLFENVASIRAEFAFAILQHLNRVKSRASEVTELFKVAWDAVRTSGLDFEVIDNAKDALYYRSLLQILLLSLQPHAQEKSALAGKPAKDSLSKSASTAAIPLTRLTSSFLEVLNKVIATNFRALCNLTHSATVDKPSLAQPSDFVVLTALLQTLVRIPSTTTIHRQIASAIADTAMVRYATSLYSWSSSLNPTDPIYGEIAILFLLSLSSVPQTAQLIATESVISSISSATITAHFRTAPSGSSTGGRGPFSTPARLHSIWSRGILPLLLNILSAVGPGIASEVASFLNSFPHQLRRCEEDLLSPLQPSPRDPYRGCITLNLAAEAHSLALLGSVIQGLRVQGAAIGVDASELEEVGFDRKKVGEAVEGLLRNPRGLRERVVPVGEREEGLRRMRGAEEGENRLVGLVVGELKGTVEAASLI